MRLKGLILHTPSFRWGAVYSLRCCSITMSMSIRFDRSDGFSACYSQCLQGRGGICYASQKPVWLQRLRGVSLNLAVIFQQMDMCLSWEYQYYLCKACALSNNECPSSQTRRHTLQVLTPEEFVESGDYLVRTCPTWSWCVPNLAWHA